MYLCCVQSSRFFHLRSFFYLFFFDGANGTKCFMITPALSAPGQASGTFVSGVCPQGYSVYAVSFPLPERAFHTGCGSFVLRAVVGTFSIFYCIVLSVKWKVPPSRLDNRLSLIPVLSPDSLFRCACIRRHVSSSQTFLVLVGDGNVSGFL